MATSAEEFRAAQAAEYGTYVAVVPISIDGARAFNPGDPVPVGHVEAGLVPEDAVARLADVAEPEPEAMPPASPATATTSKKG